ncbi:MAG TPA: hypothetical protein PLK21_02985 [Candidatus Syntrophosphaera sp.]|jgi:hypothetical protein|nr:hypothetical protein [Candidatus Syntrophosphaera sp.]HOH48334.1 hypothetical protein [Candidatus Syntrophosphaera sp.]HPW38185.1 hypothetical protein [Candidatus Syntrophosphaera sp.]HPX66686.1 hypothetical protein [Candidatus Syntrophosphaera sp.]HQC46572.1 hypothetical protein [Candidatus Syntrophosphaera sp.]
MIPSKKTCVLLLALLLASLCAAQEQPDFSFQPGRYGTLGFGYGLPYGGYGFSADMYIFDQLALTVDAGTLLYAAGYELGLKYLHGNAGKLWRPQAILLYGVNGIIPYNFSNTEVVQTEVYNGFTAGLGSQFMFGKKRRHGLDFGVTYVISSGLFKRLEELEGYELGASSRFGFYLGYRYAFQFLY